MTSHMLIVCQLLLLAAASNEEPSSCLLQQRTAPLEQVLIQQENKIQKPDKDEEEAAANIKNANNAEGEGDDESSSEGRQEKKEEATEEAVNEEKNSKETKDKKMDKDEEENEEKEGSENEEKAGRRRRRKQENGENDEKEDNEDDEKKDKDSSEDKEEKKRKKGHTVSESLRLELRLHTSIHDLKDSVGPLSDFMGKLQKALAKAAGITTDRLDVLGVRGEYESDEGATSFFEKDLKASLVEDPVLLEMTGGGKSIVDLEVLPATEKSDMAPHDVFSALKEELGRKDGPLMKGPLKDTLKGAKLKEKGAVEGFEPHHSGTSRHEHRLSCLALLALLSLRFFQ